VTLDEPMTEVVLYGWHLERTKERVEWCTANIGVYGRGWTYQWGTSPGLDDSTWYFTNSAHATMFALRFL
jgi:hypothetical protein